MGWVGWGALAGPEGCEGAEAAGAAPEGGDGALGAADDGAGLTDIPATPAKLARNRPARPTPLLSLPLVELMTPPRTLTNRR